MKLKLTAGLLLFAGLCAAQTTINVSVTLDDNTQKIVNAWRKTQCATTDANNTCIALKYDTLKVLISSLVAEAMNKQIADAGQWAIDNNDASLPASVTKAIGSVTSAQATIKATKEAKATVQ